MVEPAVLGVIYDLKVSKSKVTFKPSGAPIV